MKKSTALPAPFKELEPYLDWALPSESQRLQKREASTLAEIREFYDAMLARFQDVIDHLRQSDNASGTGHSVDVETQNLYVLMLAFADASLSVELHKSHTVPDGMPWDVWKPEHDSPDWLSKPKVRLQPTA